MQALFGLLYVFLFLSYLATGLFIVYHLIRFSTNPKLGVFGAVFFTSVLFVLLLTNAFLFFSLPWSAMLPPASNSSFGV